MESTTSWQFGTSDSYVSNNFYLEWDKDIYSMRNDGNPSVKVYGISIGDGLEQAGKTLTANGWKDCETEGGGLLSRSSVVINIVWSLALMATEM